MARGKATTRRKTTSNVASTSTLIKRKAESQLDVPVVAGKRAKMDDKRLNSALSPPPVAVEEKKEEKSLNTKDDKAVMVRVLAQSHAEQAEIARLEREYGEPQTDEDSEGENLSEEAQEIVDYLGGLLFRLSKSFLQDVMKQLRPFGFYGHSATNKVMAAQIVAFLEVTASNGGDLWDEKRIIGRVYRSCYGGCGMSLSSEEEEDDEEDDDENDEEQ